MESFPVMSDGNINISDVLDAIDATDPSFAEQARAAEIMQSTTQARMTRSQAAAATRSQPQQSQMDTTEQPQHSSIQPPMQPGQSMPYIEIVEQPASKALRFRYECEGRSAGSIPGVNSTNENKTFPGVRIVGYKGRVIVVVSCVTKDPPYRPHPHNLVGKEVCKQGVCTVEVNTENMTVHFDKLGIQCVKRKEIEAALKLRESIKVDPFRTGFDHKRQPTSIDLNAVRLCFQAFLQAPNSRKFTVPLQPVVSDPIYDKKANSDLVICKLSHCSASVAGGTEMILLCEKVTKEDIEVRFFEVRDGQLFWESKGDFLPANVHKQMAIAFRTPSYKTQQVENPVEVFIQLRRPSDGAESEPLPFQFLPVGLDDPERRRNKRPRLSPNAYLMKHVQAEAEKNSTHRTIGLSDPVVMNQVASAAYDFNIIKSEPTDRLSPFGGNLLTTAPSPPMFQVGNVNTIQGNMGGLRPINSPRRTPSPMNMYNIGGVTPQQPQPQINLACQLQPINIPPEQAPTNVLLQNNLIENNLSMEPQTNYNQLGAPSILSNAIGNAMNIGNVLDDQQQMVIPNDDFNFTQFNSNDFNNLNISDIVKDTINGDIAAGTAEESNMTDSFTKLTRKTIQELSSFNELYSKLPGNDAN